MAIPRKHWQRCPIVEAIVDIRAKTDLPEESLRELADNLKPEFSKLRVMSSVNAQLKVQDGKVVPPQPAAVIFGGIQALTEDETLVAQFRPDGFTVNNLRRYVGGDELLATTMRLWNHFATGAKPAAVTRVAIRYINRLDLPLTEGVDLNTYLTKSPDTPEHLPSVAQFLSQVVAHDPEKPGTVVLTQRLFHENTKPVVVIDIDTILNEPDVHKFSIPDGLALVRSLANETFFALITEETAKLYD